MRDDTVHKYELAVVVVVVTAAAAEIVQPSCGWTAEILTN